LHLFNHPRKLFALLLLNTLLFSVFSPSFAAEISERLESQISKRQISNRNEPSSTVSKEGEQTDGAELLTQSNFLQSAEPFFEQVRLHFTTDFSTKLHSDSVVYLAEQTNRLTTETEQLLAEMQRVQQAERKVANPRPTRRLPHVQQKASSLNVDLGVATAKQRDASDAAAQSALAELRDSLGVDLSAADGTFSPEQALTRGEYFQYLQQIDQGLVKIQYGDNISIDSVLSIAPFQAVSEFDGMNTQLRDILGDIAKVQSLTNQLRNLLNNKAARNSQVKSGLSHFTNKPVKNNELLSQTNAAEKVVTHGDFARYVIAQITEVFSSNNSFIEQEELFFTTAHYASISGQLTELTDELEGAIAQLN